MTENHNDPVDRLAAYAPNTAVLDAEWAPSARSLVRDGIPTRPVNRRLRYGSPWRSVYRHSAVAAAVATGVVVVGLLSGVLITLAHRATGSSAAGAPFVPAGITDTPRVGTGQYAHRSVTSYELTADGGVSSKSTYDDWVSPGGADWSLRAGQEPPVGRALPNGSKCLYFNDAGNEFAAPTQAFIDSLPTTEPALADYLNKHVEGSTSRAEAVFVAVGDMLRTDDLLASSALRAALVEVLSKTGYVTVHPDVTDYIGRPAVRADFVDSVNRPGELDSLYFDPHTFQLLEERSGTTSAASSPPSGQLAPSPAWTSAGPQPMTSDSLTGAATVSVMTAESVVSSLPDDLMHCPSS